MIKLKLILFLLLSELLHALTYNYFAFGSNMASSTMTNLRNLNPIASSAAILLDHRLAFNVPGTAFIEPSWASVEPQKESIVHGVLYELTQADFARVCQTEGVPFAYTLQRCTAIPYLGNGQTAGKDILFSEKKKSVSAFTLRAGRKKWRESKDVAPSKSYLNILIKGAEEYQLDKDYCDQLQCIPYAKDTFGEGTAEYILRFAELIKGKS
mmetsp:Transcript_28688/g.33335  ORF Transcript_28688/g.33335 Transcript_28688/m.33335 type:complete len:211 (-) Transcript_28688:454-1086(-)